MTTRGVVEEPVNLDEVLVSEVGEFGRYQLYSLALVALPMVVSAFLNEYIFSAAPIPHRCRITECGENSTSNSFHPDWLLNAVPATNTSAGFASCRRFEAVSNGTLQSCPSNLFSKTTTDCFEGFIYARNDSVVYEFDLGCNEALRVLAGTLSSVGSFLVLPITGYVSDIYGRKVALITSTLNMAVFGLLRAFSINYYMYLALQLVQTLLAGGIYSSSYIIATEFVGPRYRVLTGAVAATMFAVGQMTLGAVAWHISSWRYMIAALHIPCFIIIPFYWFLDESVRWQLSKQKCAEAKRTLEKVARVNNKFISEKSMNTILSPPVSSTKTVRSEDSKSSTILRSRVLLQRVLTTPVWWVTATLVYYGLSLNATSLSSKMYLNYILTTAIEIPSNFASVLVLDRIGRKATTCGGFFFSAACNLAFAFISQELATVRLVVYLLGKVGISVVMTSLYLYTAELYPTPLRHRLLALSSTAGRLGSILAPLTPLLMEYWDGLPSVIFAAMALLSGTLVLTQPETLGAKMPDTLAEAEAIGKPDSPK